MGIAGMGDGRAGKIIAGRNIDQCSFEEGIVFFIVRAGGESIGLMGVKARWIGIDAFAFQGISHRLWFVVCHSVVTAEDCPGLDASFSEHFLSFI